MTMTILKIENVTGKIIVTGEKRTMIFCRGTLKKIDKKMSFKNFLGVPTLFFIEKS